MTEPTVSPLVAVAAIVLALLVLGAMEGYTVYRRDRRMRDD